MNIRNKNKIVISGENKKMQSVLNFNYSTHMLFRVIDRKYAEQFVAGKIRFNQPKSWILAEENGKKGLGDSLEGVFLSASILDNSPFIKSLIINDNFINFEKDGLLYFRRKGIENLYCLCLYGLHSNAFNGSSVDRFGRKHFTAKVDKLYFSTFSNFISKEDYFKQRADERKSVIFITNPHEFFEKIKTFFYGFGLTQSDVIIFPVDYVDLRKPFVKLIEYPFELFLKDKDFSNQSEIRIVLKNVTDKLTKYMNEHNNIIDIGDISHIAHIYNNYFNDLILEKRENEILFNLPEPQTVPLSSMTMRELLAHYMQIYNDKLPYEATMETRNEWKRAIEETILQKYDIYLSVINGQITLSNVNVDINEIIDK